jgi:ABC-type dipeptide/oligopeptide/nickel transport system permease subunit
MTLVNAGAADWFDVEGEEEAASRDKRGGTLGLSVGISMLAIMLIMGIAVPLLSPYGRDDFVGIPYSPPSGEFYFGTDQLGRDIFTRVFSAVYLDLGVAFLGVMIPLIIGSIIGIVYGISRNKTFNSIIGTVIDAINAFPLLVLAIALAALFGSGLSTIILALAVTNWARYARIARTRTLVVRQQGYIEATQVLGYSKGRRLFRHLMPNVTSESVAYALSDLILVIMLIAGLSFLGFGAPPPTPEWGAMISEGRPAIQLAPWLVLFPGAALCWAGIAFSFIAEGFIARQRDGKS